MNWEIIITVISTLGGFEGIKWWMNRKTNARMLDIKADSDEFHLIRERLETADKHLLEKEKLLYEKEQRFHEQTKLVRDLQRQLLDKQMEIGDQKAEISALKAERAMKLCERRGCINREPQSGY